MATDPPHALGPDDNTPNDLPMPTLIETRTYVQLLSEIATSLHKTANTFAEIVHLLRVAPMGASTRAQLSDTFAQVEEIGRRGRAGFVGAEP